MTIRTMLGFGVVAVAVFLAVSPAGMNAGQVGSQVDFDNDDLSGVVTSSNGPEAGVWVIRGDPRSGHEVRPDCRD